MSGTDASFEIWSSIDIIESCVKDSKTFDLYVYVKRKRTALELCAALREFKSIFELAYGCCDVVSPPIYNVVIDDFYIELRTSEMNYEDKYRLRIFASNPFRMYAYYYDVNNKRQYVKREVNAISYDEILDFFAESVKQATEAREAAVEHI